MNLKLRLNCALPDYLRDAEEVVRAFYPAVEIVSDAEGELKCSAALRSDGLFSYEIGSPFGERRGERYCDGELLLQKKYSKRFYKNILYDLLSEASGVTLPYGSLTGVRPTKLYYELSERCGEGAEEAFKTEFRVSAERAAFVRDTVREQAAVYDRKNDGIDLYVNIPFCPSRCAYCSFLSAEYPKVKKSIPDYVAAVKRELAAFEEYSNAGGKRLRAVYVGGGTPTALTPEELNEILAAIPKPECEFTVEAGRPDTLCDAHLENLKRAGVTRISVNPQTLSDDVLKNVGRKHTAADFLRAFEAAKGRGFLINTDLIAGLKGETEESFLAGVARAAALKPDNLTVHTLSVKRGSTLAEAGERKGAFGAAGAMVDGARKILYEAGYRPYYLYRQKNMTDNLENAGYALAGKASCYNVDIMEETTDVYAVGAGAMSKRVEQDKNLITRLANPKGLPEYLSRIGEIILKKRTFFDRDERGNTEE